MLRKNIVLFSIILFAFLIALPAYGGMLDGKTFVGENGHLGKNGSGNDEIKFENGKFKYTTSDLSQGALFRTLCGMRNRTNEAKRLWLESAPYKGQIDYVAMDSRPTTTICTANLAGSAKSS